MAKAKHARKNNNRRQKLAVSVAVTAALAVSAGMPAFAVEGDGAPVDVPAPASEETTGAALSGGTDSTAEPNHAQDDEDTRTDEQKHEDNKTIVEDNKEQTEQNQEIIDALPELDGKEEDDATVPGENEDGEGEDGTTTPGDNDNEEPDDSDGKTAQEQLTDDLTEKGEEIKDFVLPDMPQAPDVDGMSQADAEAVKSAYEAALAEYNRLIEGEGGYNENVEAYNEALNQLKTLIDKNNQNTAGNVEDAAEGNSEKIEKNDKTIEENDGIVSDNKDTIESNETDSSLNDAIKGVEDAGKDLDPDALEDLNAAQTELQRIESELAALDTSSMSKDEAEQANKLLEDYKKAVEDYEAAVKNYNADVGEYKAAVEKYNKALEQYIADYNKGVVNSNNTTLEENHGTEDTEASGTIGQNEDTIEKNQDAVGEVKGEDVNAGASGNISITDDVVTITEGGKTYTLTLDKTVASGDVTEALDRLQKATVLTIQNLEGKSADEIKEIVDAYNEAVASYNEAAASYNGDVAEYNAAIEKYQNALAAYNRVIGAKNQEIQNTNDGIISSNNNKINGNNADIENLDTSGSTIINNQSIWNSGTSYAEISGNIITIKNGDETYTLTANTEDGTLTSITIIMPGGKEVSLSAEEIEKVAAGVTFDTTATTLEAYNAAVQQYIKAIDAYNQDDVATYNAFANAYNQAMAAYKAVVDEANTSLREDNAAVLQAGGTLDTMLNFNDKSTAIKDTEKYEALKKAVTAAQAALNNAAVDLNTQESIDAYNELIAAYNSAVENYNSFVKKCNGASGSSTPDVKPVEISNLPLFVSTATKDAQFFIVKDSTVPKETGSTGYEASGYTGHNELFGNVLIGTVNIDDLVPGDKDNRVEVRNMYTLLSDAELPEGFDSAYTYFKDIDGNYYVINRGGKEASTYSEGGYLYRVSETGEWQRNGTVTFGPNNLYQYKYEGGKLYAVSTGGGSDTYLTVKNGYISAYTPNSQNIIVQTEFNTSKFNFASEDALSEYFKNVGILVDNGSAPDNDQMKNVIKEYFDQGDQNETISKAYEAGLVGIQWYVVKDNNTGTKDGHTHVDGALYWKNTLEVVDHSKMNTLGTLTPVKNHPVSLSGATVLMNKTLDTKKQSLPAVTLTSLTGLSQLTGGGEAQDESTWKDALSYQTLVSAKPIESPYDKLTVPTGSFVATEGLEELAPLTPIEGEEIIITPAVPTTPSTPVVIIPVITPGDGELAQEIVKEITPQLPELLEQGAAEAVAVQAPQEKLPQTGQSWALAGLLAAAGTFLTALGIAPKRRKDEHEA